MENKDLVQPGSKITVKKPFANILKKGDLLKPSEPNLSSPAKNPVRLPEHDNSYSCRTQAKTSLGDAESLVLATGGNIEIWESKSVIKFVVHGKSFPNLQDAEYAAHELNAGAKMWNDAKIGVTFEWVADIEEAAFVLVYGGNDGNTLARAFFPNTKDLNTMRVYSRAFDEDSKPFQSNIFAHEIGHVLGLRHEFAIEKESFDKAVLFGNKNPMSVMSYKFPPKIQPSDKKTTRILYGMEEGTDIEGFPLVRHFPG